MFLLHGDMQLVHGREGGMCFFLGGGGCWGGGDFHPQPLLQYEEFNMICNQDPYAPTRISLNVTRFFFTFLMWKTPSGLLLGLGYWDFPATQDIWLTNL